VDPSSGGSPWSPRRRETARRTGAGKSGNSQGKIPLMEKEDDRKIGTNDKKIQLIFKKEKIGTNDKKIQILFKFICDYLGQKCDYLEQKKRKNSF
jgi:hypothetical protein